MINGVPKGNGIKLMVWACIWGSYKGELIAIRDKLVNCFVYTRFLEEGLLDAWQEYEDVIGDSLFQQDNPRIHTAAHIRDCLEEHNVDVVDNWPPNSPDMNPVEHCWKRLKEKLHIRFPDIARTPGGPVRVKEVLVEALDVV